VFSYWLLRLVIIYRWARLTTRQYGLVYLALKERPRHARIGRSVARPSAAHGSVTGWNLPSGELVQMLRQERQERELVNA